MTPFTIKQHCADTACDSKGSACATLGAMLLEKYNVLAECKDLKAMVDAVSSSSTPDVSQDADNEPYAELKRVFDQAFKSQTEGKGRARHNKTGTIPFERQRIMTISETIGSPHGLTYQVNKKMLEALEMPEIERSIHELEGAMVYLGALILYVERRGSNDSGK